MMMTNWIEIERAKAALVAAGIAFAGAMAMLAWASPAAAQQCQDGVDVTALQCGTLADALDTGATAVGQVATADGASATAVGFGSDATGDHTTAIGGVADAQGTGATALGWGADASGSVSTAIGSESYAGIAAVAIGANADASTSSMAIGTDAESSALSAVAVGIGATASAENAVALGTGSVADVADTVSVGSSGNERRIVNVADGVNATDAASYGQLQAVETQVTSNTTQININSLTLLALAANNAAQQGQIDANTAGVAANAALLATHSAMLDDHEARIVALEQMTFDLGDTLARFDDEIDGSTAVAIAMSGNAFLPGTRFNMTGNIGTYNGAVAGSLQVGAMVSDRAAVNAGIATGFNKKGKVGARVGFTLGW